MRPVFVAWLVRHGWPAWFAPDYATMVGFATLLGAVLVLRQAERDGARVHIQARAIICAYLAALVGGYLFEWIRMIPVAIAERSVAPIVFAGRAAYGGLIFGAIAPVLYFVRRRETFVDFLDRATIGMGIAFACVRFGCFLEGCDFGRPTASWLGVRFPAGSAAADAHHLAGWIPAGAPSLPVHPTELYESCVGILATLFALVPLRKGRRDGAAFAIWLVTYAMGRFLLELLRGDVERGRYASLSTAQWVSLAILAGVFYALIARRRAARLALAAATGIVALLALARGARADEPLPALPPPSAPPAQPAPPTLPPTPSAQPASGQPNVVVVPAPPAQQPAPAEKKSEEPEPKHVVTARLALTTSVTVARPDVPSGWAGELDVLYRLRLGQKTRLDLGLEGRRYENAEAIQLSLGVAGDLVLEASRHFEVLFTFVPHHTWFDFKSDFFTNTNAYGLRYAIGAQFPIERVVLGATPLAFTTTSSTTVGVISQWEPRIWAGLSF
jgi:prolipoprotein diacylglyceryltransferase